MCCWVPDVNLRGGELFAARQWCDKMTRSGKTASDHGLSSGMKGTSRSGYNPFTPTFGLTPLLRLAASAS